jgi:uncharacterized RDD family membrane protein YckC
MNQTTTDLWNPARVIGKFLFSAILAQRSLAMLIDLSLVFGVYQPFGSGLDNALVNGGGVYLYVGQATTIPYFWLAVTVIAYFTFFEALFGTTPGKAILKLHVVMLDGGRPSFGAILMRNVFRLVDALPFLYIVGLLVAQNTLHEQRVGDIVAKTSVVPRAKRSGDDPAIPRLRLKLLVTGCALAVVIVGGMLFQYATRPPLIIQSWANANNSYHSAPANGTTRACGPTPQWPDPLPAANVSGGQARQPILQYALGAPQWSVGTVTYPVTVQMWNDTTDSGALPVIPRQVSMTDLSSGPDVYTGHIILTWAGPLGGGWRIQGGDMSCAKAG